MSRPRPLRRASRPVRTRRRLGLAAVLIAAGLVMSGCGSDSDPESWEEAREGDFAVQANYLKACELANDDERGFSPAAARQFCRCSFDRLYADGEGRGLTFEQFKKLDDALRKNPDPGPLIYSDDEEVRAAWRKYEDLVRACEAEIGA